MELYLWYTSSYQMSYIVLLLPCSAPFKESIAEFSKLFQSFPAFGTFVLELSPLKQWHALDIADHIPVDQCLMVLSSKLKDVSSRDVAEMVGNAYNCSAIETEAHMCILLFTGRSYWSVFSLTASQDERPSIMVCQLLLCILLNIKPCQFATI